MEIILHPIATITNKRTTPSDDFWGDTYPKLRCCPIYLKKHLKASGNSRTWRLFIILIRWIRTRSYFQAGRAVTRNGQKWVFFASEKGTGPTSLAFVRLNWLSIRAGQVKYLDAIDGTPVLDIKPVFKEFEVKGEIKQPQWAVESISDY